MIGKFIRDINCVKFCGFAGQNKQRLDHGFHRLALLGIEFVQEIDHVTSSIACLGYYRKGREGEKK